MSNPWKRDWFDYDEDGDAILLDGLAMATAVHLGWEDIESAAEDRDHIERSALRLRHGARAACKRLREERDEARQHFAEERETALEIRDEQRAAERERDAARLELRALEWLMNESKFENGLVWRRNGRLWTGDEVEHESYASAARALGWEG